MTLVQLDPRLPLNCPKCPCRLRYVGSEPPTEPNQDVLHVYECPEHGRWRFGLDTHLERVPATRH